MMGSGFVRKGAVCVMVFIASGSLAPGQGIGGPEDPGSGPPGPGGLRPRAGKGVPGSPEPGGRLAITPGMNILDVAQYGVADIYLEQEKFDDAIRALEVVVKESPDQETVSVSHLNIGNIYRRHLREPEKAISEYEKVTGRARLRARHAIVETCIEAGKSEEAASRLSKWVEETDSKQEKVTLLLVLAKLYRKQGNYRKAIAVLERARSAAEYKEVGPMLGEGGGAAGPGKRGLRGWLRGKGRK